MRERRDMGRRDRRVREEYWKEEERNGRMEDGKGRTEDRTEEEKSIV